ncbi:hypothetical protein ACWEQ3_43190 [Streptomyces mirabilis]|uniref:hypothetical protein n=1 Tax=Streptomyces mirabilis TaxID=68239 RepID=UPI0033AD6263
MKTTVVRTTLEGLVATSHAHRTKRGSSVFSDRRGHLGARGGRTATGDSSQLSIRRSP